MTEKACKALYMDVPQSFLLLNVEHSFVPLLLQENDPKAPTGRRARQVMCNYKGGLGCHSQARTRKTDFHRYLPKGLSQRATLLLWGIKKHLFHFKSSIFKHSSLSPNPADLKGFCLPPILSDYSLLESEETWNQKLLPLLRMAPGHLHTGLKIRSPLHCPWGPHRREGPCSRVS